MKIVTISFVFLLALSVCGFGSIHQESPTIMIPNTPRMVVKDGKAQQAETQEESFSRPNLTKGCIENQAFPYVPRVWLLNGSKRVLLVGQTKKGPPQVLDFQILEFSLPPGLNQVFIERWRDLGGEWQMLPPEFLTFQVAKPRRGWGDYNGSGYYDNNHYDWQIVIRQNRSFVYEGGRTGWYGHGRWGW